jgi:hypothetical protein
LAVKIIGKLQDGAVFTKKGHDEEPFKFKTDEGKNILLSLYGALGLSVKIIIQEIDLILIFRITCFVCIIICFQRKLLPVLIVLC